MRIKDIIVEAVAPSQVRNLYKTLNSKNIPNSIPTDDLDDSELGKDYTDSTSKVMGWRKEKGIKNRPQTDNDDESYYENSNDKIKKTIDDLRNFAEKEGLEVIVDRWDKNTKWAIGVTLSNNRNFRINFKTNGDISSLDFNFPKGADQTDTIKVAQAVISKYPKYEISSTGYRTKITKKDGKITLDDFKSMVGQFENMMTDPKMAKSLSIKQVSKSRNAGSLINRNITQSNYYIGVATMIYVAVRFGLKNIVPRGGKDGSSQGTFDLNDHGITVGISAAAKKMVDENQKPYREHAVPCDFIIKKAIQMIKEETPKSLEPGSGSGKIMDPHQLINVDLIGRVAKMIKRDLVIVLITQEERKKIDFDLGLLSAMPEGDAWDPLTGDVLSRLKAGGIRIYSLDGSSRLGE